MSPKGGGFLDAAYQILREEGKPMHVHEIVRIGLSRGMFETRAQNPYTSLANTLHSDVTRYGNRRGFTWLGNNVFGLREWGDDETSAAPSMPERTRTVHTPKVAVAPAGLDLAKLERIRQFMPSDEFRHDWGDIYDQLLAAERAKAITPANDRYLLDRIRPLVQHIQDFLQGHGNESPKSEAICDWIFICYTLELYREGAALWRYVHQEEVNAWQYERTAKSSAACRVRAGS